MEEMNRNIGKNLKRWRIDSGYTLDQVAQMTGVSKSMIGQIERGDSSPTVTTLWKISNGLKISFSRLMAQEEAVTYRIGKGDLEPLDETDRSFEVLTYIPYSAERRFETFMVNVSPGSVHESEPHRTAIEEFVVVLEGELSVGLVTDEHHLVPDEMIRFDARQPHTYRNRKGQPAKAMVTIVYP